MGNDMFNDEQLAYAEIVQKETEEALGWWKERALKAEAKLADKYPIEEQYEAACGDRDGLLRMVETLRGQKNALLAERDAALSRALAAEARLAELEADRDKAYRAVAAYEAKLAAAETRAASLSQELLAARDGRDTNRARAEAAEAALAECDDELENATCPPMRNETIPERIARLAGLVSTTLRDEQAALEGKEAAEARVARGEAGWIEDGAKLLAAEARCHDLERQRTEYDCRFVGRYAEMSGSHCPPGGPCQRCQLEAAEARCAELEALASFGASLLSEWWENDCGDLDGVFVQDEAEKAGLWHHVERHADGVECEWCCGEEPCGELTEAGSRALAGGGK